MGWIYNRHFCKTCFHPIVAFTGDGDCLAVQLRPGNPHSADGVLESIKPMVTRCHDYLTPFRLRGHASFALPDICGHNDELLPRVNFIATNSTRPAWKMMKPYNGRANVKNRIKEGKNISRWDKTSCHGFQANRASLKMGALACNLLHMIREFHLRREDVKRPMEWLTRLPSGLSPGFPTAAGAAGTPCFGSFKRPNN